MSAISACTALMFALPIALVAGPMYPAGGWRGVILWTVVSIVMGFGANAVVSGQRLQAVVSRAGALGLDSLVETQTAIARRT